MELVPFFRALPHSILAAFRERHVLGESDEDSLRRATVLGLQVSEVDTAAKELAERFGDKLWVRELLKGLPRTHHVALIALLQCRGIAGGTWLLQELTQEHGMSEDLWAEVLHELGEQLLVFGNSRSSPPLFYIVPQALVDVLGAQFSKRLALRAERDVDDVQPTKDANFKHPVGYSLLSFLAYLRQHPIKVTRAREIFKKHRDEVASFFSSLWGEGVEDAVLDWHLDLVRDLGLVRQRGDHLAVDELVLKEFLGLTPLQRRDLYLAWFERNERLLRWLLDLLMALPVEGWVSQPRLRTLYRRRYMGDVFHSRFVQKSYYMPPSGYHDPVPPLELLFVAGLLEGGLHDGSSHLRLTSAGRVFMSGEDVGSIEANAAVKFLLQPTFEILAPVGLPLDAIWRLGEVAELKRVDRANTFLLTRDSTRRAMDEGWRLDDLLDFLREASQAGLPQNVESTIRDWVGRHGEIEFHDTLVVRAAGDRWRKLLAVVKKARVPHEALAKGVLAIPRERREAVLEALEAAQLEPAPKVRTHDLADEARIAEGPLHGMLEVEDATVDEDEDGAAAFPNKGLFMLGAPTAEGGKEAAANRGFRSGRVGSNAVGADISLKPAAAGAGDLLKLSPGKTISLIKAALRLRLDVEVLYPSTGENDPGGLARVTPHKITELGGSSHFTGRHHRLEEDMQFQIKRIRGIRLAT